MPESLAVHHKGLSTLIGMGDIDARGKVFATKTKNGNSTSQNLE